MVVTIVVLLILAAITINLVFSNNGIIKKAQDSKEITRIREIEGEIQIAWLDAQAEDEVKQISLEQLRKYFEDELKKQDMNATVTYNEETKQFEVNYKDHQMNIDYNKGGNYSSVWKEAYLTIPIRSSDKSDLIGVLKNNNLAIVPNVEGFGQTISSSDNILEQEIKVAQLIPGYSSYVIDEEGSIWSWGYNKYGELGNGTTTDTDTPQKITSINKKVIQLIIEGSSCYAIDEEGSLWSWGNDTHTPQKITSINKKVTQLIAGNSCYAIDENGSIWSWGDNYCGELGNGTTTDNYTPKKITSINKKVTQLIIEGSSCYAIDEEGSIWSWGNNESGQLGNGTKTNNPTPQKFENTILYEIGYAYSIFGNGKDKITTNGDPTPPRPV